MKKAPIVGTDFYKAKGLKTIMVFVPKSTYHNLRRLAYLGEMSLQTVCRHILVAAAKSGRPCP